MLLRADLADGVNVSVGSGTLVATRLVLTAAHVVFDERSGNPLTGVLAGPATAPLLTAARVVWPTTYRHNDSPAALDVALVEITDPGWAPSITGTVRWGRLTGRSTGVECESTGFPRVLRDPDHTREADQISGTINPRTGSVTGRYDITVTSAAPASGTQLSPWSGASGAGVFASGLLTAVLVIDSRGFAHDRLTAIPCHRILSKPDARRVLQEHGVDAEAESVELSQVLITAGREGQVLRRQRQQLSPAMLLRADFEVVRFHGREDQLAELTDWCTDPEIEVGIRLVLGPGGRGKTRLARKLVADVRSLPPPEGDAARSWVAGFLDAQSAGHPLARVADTAAPVLLVVDYAETRTHQIAELLLRLWVSDCAPVRVLLLARAAGDWWQQLAQDLGGPLGATTVLSTLDNTVEEQRRAFRSAVTDLATRVSRLDPDAGVDWPALADGVLPPEDLPSARYGSPLTLQLVALLSLLDRVPSGDPAASAGGSAWIDNPEQYLLTQHEEKYWSVTSPPWLNLQRSTLAEVVTASTLVGAKDRDEAITVLRGLPALQGQTENALVAIATWVGDLYPAPIGYEWGGLQPDRVGEHLIAATLARNTGLLAAILGSAGDTQMHQAVTVLARVLASRSLPVAITSELGTQLSDIFSSMKNPSRLSVSTGNKLAHATLQVATETAEPAPLLAALSVILGKLPTGPLRDLAGHLPRQSLALSGLAADITSALVARLRGDARQDAEPELARCLNNLANRLSGLGRREEALAAIEEATALYRRLATDHPDEFNTGLAGSLNNLSHYLSGMERREEALAAIEEATALYRRLADDHPDEFDTYIGGSLNNLSNCLSGLGRREEALAAIEEATALYRRLATDHPDEFNTGLATSLHTLSNCLWGLGRREEALTAIEEAVELRRRLAADHPDAFNPDLARSLHNFSVRLNDASRREDALAATEEAVTLYRRLAADHPDTFNPNLARSLHNFSVRLNNASRREDALTATEEAVTLYRRLAAGHPDTFTTDFATSLHTFSVMLDDASRHEDALTATEEAVTLYRRLAADHPDTFNPNLARSLHNSSVMLGNAGHHEDALTATEEAVTLYRRLAADHPDTFTADLAGSLNNLSVMLDDAGHHEDALAAIEEAVELRRRLAADHPDTPNPDLARSLNNLSGCLSRLGHRVNALTAIEEAVELRRRLAADHPDTPNPDLATSLHNLAGCLSSLGRRQDALTAIEEATALRQR